VRIQKGVDRRDLRDLGLDDLRGGLDGLRLVRGGPPRLPLVDNRLGGGHDRGLVGARHDLGDGHRGAANDVGDSVRGHFVKAELVGRG